MRNHNAALTFAEDQVKKMTKVMDDLDTMLLSVLKLGNGRNRRQAMYKMLSQLYDNVSTQRYCIQHNIDYLLSKEA